MSPLCILPGTAILSPAFRGSAGIINPGRNELNGGQNFYSTVRTLCGESLLVLLLIEQRLDGKSRLALCRTSKVNHTKRNSVLTALLRTYIRRCLLCMSLNSNHSPANLFAFVGILCVHIYLISVARLTAPFVLSGIRHHIQLGVKYTCVFSYSYMYFGSRELPACQTRLSD